MPAFSKPKLVAESTFHFKNEPNSKIIYSVSIPYPVCKQWHEAVGSSIPGYINLLNSFLAENCSLSLDKSVNRLGELLRRKCGTITKKLKKSTGNSFNALRKKTVTLNIVQEDLLTADVAQERLGVVEHDLASANEKISDLERNIFELHSELMELAGQKDSLTEGIEREVIASQNLLQTNQEMQRYVENLCGISIDTCYKTASEFSNFSRSYQLRRLKEVNSRAKCALWFLDSFGLKLDSLTVVDDKGCQHGIQCNTISSSEKDTLEKVLYILDQFYVSDACYHELTVLCNGLPKSYLIKQLRKNLNTICHLQRTPGPEEGAEIDAEAELTFAIKSFLSEHAETLQHSEQNISFSVKFCGDGTNVSRKSGMCVMSFCLFSTEVVEEKQAPHHAVAVVKGHESYELYRLSFANVWTTINALHRRGSIDVEGKSYKLNVYLGADYKFLLMVLGMSGATSNNACIYCKVSKSERWDMSKPECFYTDQEFDSVRSIEEMQSLYLTNSFGCKHLPLINLPLENVIVDELHMLLRITDRLLENLIQDVRDLDCKEKLGAVAKSIDSSNSHLNKLVQAIRACGVSFNVWETKDANGKGTGRIEFSSLVGDEKKLLKFLPEKLLNDTILHHETESVTVKIWKDFATVYKAITCKYDDTVVADAGTIFGLARDWLLLFLSLEGKRKMYEKARVTPYMHLMVYHIPKLCMLYNGIRQFSAQGMEKLNDVVKSIHKQHSNKIEACGDIVSTCLEAMPPQ